MSNAAKNFDILATGLNVLHNYFDGSTNFSDLYPTKILDLSTKSFFPCIFSGNYFRCFQIPLYRSFSIV